MLYWLLKRILIGPLARFVWRPWLDGAENVPVEGRAILASNHLSFCDSVFMPLAMPRQVKFPAKLEYFERRGLKGWCSRVFLSSVGQVPIDRSSGPAARPALRELERVLEGGGLVGFYPEGSRSPDGRLYRGKTGIARLALATGAPVIPIAMIDTDVLQPIGRVLPKFRPRPGVRVGRPLDFSRYEGLAGDRFVERSMTDEIMYALMQLSGQEYVDVYAAKVKTELDRTGRSGSTAARAAARAIARRPNPDPVERTADSAERAPHQRAS